MESFKNILEKMGGDLDVFEGEFYEFLKAEKAKKGDDKEPKAKSRKSSPGGKNPEVTAKLEEEVKVAVKEAAKADKEEKRIARMSPAMTKELETALTTAEIPHDEKVLKKLKDEFRAYVNELTDDDYKKSSLTDHMRDFANLKKEEKVDAVAEAEKPKKGGRKKAVKAEEAVEAKEEVKKDEAKPEKKKPGRKPKAKEEAKKGDDEEPENSGAEPATGGGAANFTVKNLTLTELMERSERLVINAGRAGIYFDPETGETVTGPEEDADEDMEEVKFDGKTFAVGETTGRVYEQDAEGLDVFVGFRGAGKFKHM